MITHFKIFENKRDIDRELILAINDRDYQKVEDCLRIGADPNSNVDKNGWTLLMQLLNWGDINISELLLKYGADVYTPIRDNFYLLDWINKIVDPNYRKKVIKIIKRYNPNYLEEMEMLKTAKNYNL